MFELASPTGKSFRYVRAWRGAALDHRTIGHGAAMDGCRCCSCGCCGPFRGSLGLVFGFLAFGFCLFVFWLLAWFRSSLAFGFWLGSGSTSLAHRLARWLWLVSCSCCSSALARRVARWLWLVSWFRLLRVGSSPLARWLVGLLALAKSLAKSLVQSLAKSLSRFSFYGVTCISCLGAPHGFFVP